MGDVCGKNHVPEGCTMLGELSSRGRLKVIQKKQTCQFCF